MTLFESMLRIARHGPLVVELHVLDVLDGTTMKRQEVARAARALIGEAFGFDDERVEAVEGLATVIALPEEPLSRAAAPADTAPGTALDPRDELL